MGNELDYLAARVERLERLVDESRIDKKTPSLEHDARTAFIKVVRERLHDFLQVKTGWGRNEVKRLFDQAVSEAAQQSHSPSYSRPLKQMVELLEIGGIELAEHLEDVSRIIRANEERKTEK